MQTGAPQYYKQFALDGNIVAQKYRKGTVVHVKDGIEQVLPFTKIIDCSHQLIRAVSNNDTTQKWGLIQANGDMALPAVYDFITKPLHPNYIKVFNGDFTWNEFDEPSADLFYEYIDEQSWNGDIYEATLGNGKWGIVDANNQTIIPIQYNWVELYAPGIFLYNLGGSHIIRWFSGDDKERHWAIVGGFWGVLGIATLANYTATTMDELLQLYTLLKQTADYDEAYRSQAVGKYFINPT
jgi:hypothetical protein